MTRFEFEESGQNKNASLVMMQLNDIGKGMERITVWPKSARAGRTISRSSLLRRRVPCSFLSVRLNGGGPLRLARSQILLLHPRFLFLLNT